MNASISQTATATGHAERGAGTGSRILNVVKLHFANPWTTLWVPMLILAVIFLVNLAIWWLISTGIDDAADRADATDGFQWSGASLYIFVYMMVVAIQAMNATFGFALGFSTTRRDYYLGSSVFFVVLSLIWTVLLTALAAIEEATGGWGLGGRMFTATYFGDGAWWERGLVFLGMMLFFFFFGAAVATIYVRWKANGLYAFFVLMAVALVGSIALVTLTESWPAVGEWFSANRAPGVVAWSLIPTVLAAGAGYLLLQRATPRSA